ncbi:MAG: PA14 domain-containing protein [Verrucomicrobiales bacterium]
MKISSALTLASIIAAAASSLAQDAAPTPAAPEGNGVREWRDASGKVLAEGRIEDVRGKAVIIGAKETGVPEKIAIADLHAEDRAAAKAWFERNSPPEGFGKPDATVAIRTLVGQMKYDLPEFSVKPGAKVRLTFFNDDDMHHNIVLCTPGKNNFMDVAQKAWELAGDGFAKEWIPAGHPKMLEGFGMVDPRACRHFYFTAPTAEGDYPYVCTLPGHAMLMNGTMVVAKNQAGLSELTYTLYKGSWDKLPDFEKLDPAATDHVPGGKIDLGVAKMTENFALVFDGIITAPKEGAYTFTVGSDDGSRLLIDGKEVANADGIHPVKSASGKVMLSAGPHRLRVEYFEKGGEEELFASWSGPGFKEQSLSKGNVKRGKPGPSGIPLAAENEAVIYRNFIEGADTPRGIGVGYPGGINLCYDADNLRVALFWQGGFIDAARHWNGRGQGNQPPLGYGVAKGAPGVPLAVLASDADAWPTADARGKGIQQGESAYAFQGYALRGEARLPVFRYRFGDLEIEDAPAPQGSPATGDAAIDRRIKISGDAPDRLFFRAAAGQIEDEGDGWYRVNGESRIQVLSPKPILRDAGGARELLVPASGGEIHLVMGW